MSKSVPKRGKRFEERQALIAKATAGDADAQSRMGDVCRVGDQLTPQDLTAATTWYRLAAEQGDVEAQNNLGAMYQNGMGVPTDLAEAARWYRLAAEQNAPTAKFNLGCLLREGKGVSPAPEEGLRLIREAADAGDAAAASMMGWLLRAGDGMPADLVGSAEYFLKAARRGDELASCSLGGMEPTLRELALTGRKEAAWCLKEMYEAGLGVPKDRKGSYLWGQLFATIDNIGRPADVIQILDASGELVFPLYDDFVRPAPADNRYGLEWLYQSGAEPAKVDHRTRGDFIEYRAKRDAGMPPPSAAAWPKDTWWKWKLEPARVEAPAKAKRPSKGWAGARRRVDSKK